MKPRDLIAFTEFMLRCMMEYELRDGSLLILSLEYHYGRVKRGKEAHVALMG